MDILFWIINLATVLAVYVWWIRPILMKTPALSDLYAREATYFAALSAKLSGIKQKLTAAVIYLAGIIIPVHDYLAPYLTGTDVTPLFPKIMTAVPTEAWPFILIGLTALLDYFRRVGEKKDNADA